MDQKRKDVGGKFSIQGKTYTIYGGVNPIGRNREAVVNIKNLSVSQQHALFILVDDDLHFVSDLNSSNGTFIKNKKLEPLRLYRLESGWRLRFGEVEGTYTKYTSQDVERLENISCVSENTQNCTQNFYCSDTQIMDNTDTTIKHNNISQEGNYISSQILAEMADKLEDSYKEESEGFKVIDGENVEKNEPEIIVPQESNFDVHEAQTQVIETEQVLDYEAETQVIDTPTVETPLKSIIDLHELETQEINIYSDVGEVYSLDVVDEMHVTNERISPEPIENPQEENCLPLDSNPKSSLNLSQDNDLVNPVGLTRNVLDDSLNSSQDDSDTDIIRPVKKSINIFESQDSTFEETREKSEILDKSESDIVRPVKKSVNIFESQESEGIEEDSNDSVDFLTMQKIPSTQKYSNSEEDTPKREENNEKITKNDETKMNETDGKSSQVDEGSETEDEIEMRSLGKVGKGEDVGIANTNSSLGKPESSDSETDIEGNDTDSKRRFTRKNKKTMRKNDDPEMSAKIVSDSETDIEGDESLIDNLKNNKSIGLILEESALEEDNPENLEKSNSEVAPCRLSVPCNVSLNESDFIPATQEDRSKPSSQNSKLENSENSFKLGLTQLMEEENISQSNRGGESEGNSDSGIENKECSQGKSQEKKKFTFKKSSLGATESVDITLDYDGDIYQASTQKLCEEKDDHVFVQPTQEAPKRSKHNKNESVDEEIYILSTQRLDGNPTKKTSDDEEIYMLSTQQLETSPTKNDKDEKMKPTRLSENEIYQMPTQKISINETEKEVESNNKSRDDDDIFATQIMDPTESPTKCLESELENMFASQRADDTMAKIQDIVHNNGIADDKLPREDKDLEAILATQKMLDSPKRNKKEPPMNPSVESQLEVIFASQPSNLPPDKFVRPPNPLINLFDTQNEQPSSSDKDRKTSEDEESFAKTKKTSQVGLEQSFALLEAKSTKIRRSGRNKDCEEITVSCPKSRVSMVVAPNDLTKEEEPKPVKNARSSRKRQPPAALENYVTEVKENRRSKRRRFSENSNTSDEENEPSSSRSGKQNVRNKRLNQIQEDKEDTKRPETPSKKRSSRLQKQKVEETEVKDTDVKKTSKPNDNNNGKENEILPNKSAEDCEGTMGEEDKAPKVNRSRKLRKNEIEEGESLSNASHGEVSSKKRSKKDSEESLESDKVEKRSNTRKLRGDVENPKTPSRTSKRGTTIEVTTPPKMQRVSEATPSCSNRKMEVQDTPSRAKRKLKPKVVFTMMENPRLESQIKQLGGSVVDSIETGTVLLTKFVKRSMKLLSAVGLGKPICSEEWVVQSKKENNFLDPWDYILVDEEAEKKWDFSLRTSLERSLQAKLFQGCSFQLLVTNAVDVLKGAIESCGGKIVTRTPKSANNFIVVASADQKDKYKRLLKQQPNLIIVEPEAIFDGVLRQEIRFDRHLLN